MEEKRSSYAVIPCYIMDDEKLHDGAKMLYARISMYSQEGRCWASNRHLSEKHGVDTRTIQRWLKQLSDEGYIEIEVETGGFHTKRNIWITNDFKKSHTKRHPCHPSPTSMSPLPDTNVVHINTSKTNIKKNNKQESVVVPSFIEEISDLSDSEKKALAKFPEERVKLAVEFNRVEPPTTTKIQQLIWHCQQTTPPKPKTKNKKVAIYEIVLNIQEKYQSRNCELRVTKEAAYFDLANGRSGPRRIDFSNPDAEQEIKKCLNLYKFKPFS
jgi:hypothetical protein